MLTLSVVIPAFNQKGTIQQILEAVQAVPVKREANLKRSEAESNSFEIEVEFTALPPK